MREVVGKVSKVVLRPSLVGALYVLALAIRAALANVPDDDLLGKNKQQLRAFIEKNFPDDINRVVVATVASALVVGAVLGTVAGVLIVMRDRIAARRVARSPYNRALTALGVTIVLHGLLELWAMAETPQLYAMSFYARGGVWRAIQTFATDFLGPQGVVLVAVALLTAYLVGPPSAWREYPARLSALFAKVQGNGKAVGSAGATAAVVVLVALALRAPSSAHAEDPPSAASAKDARPNILILAADSLRNDRVDPKIAPHLSALAAKGTRFDRAYVSLPRTFPSWVTILTGRHAHHHGIRSMFPRWDERAKDFDAVPERLAKAGYATGVVSDYAGDIFGRIDLGFGFSDVPSFDFRQLVRQKVLERETPLLPVLHSRVGRLFFPVMRELAEAADPSMLTRDAIRALDRVQDKPFFLTVFYSTAHFPYAAPAPYYRRFTDPDYDGRFKYHRPRGLGRETPPDDKDIRQIQGLYDGAVQAIDDAIARVLATLEERGLSKNTIIIITADHGETLYDHGHGQGHGDHLFGDEGIHVPLIIVDPRKPGPARRETRIVRDVDIAPTIYELAGIDAPPDLDGRSLAPALDGKPIAAANAYAETELWFTEEIPALSSDLRLPYPVVEELLEAEPQHGYDMVLQKKLSPLTLVARHRMVRDEKWKLIYIPTRAGVKYMLFDTEADPGEVRDVAGEHADVVARLKTELWAWMLRDPAMVERGGYLVPRDVTGAAPSAETGIRLNDVRAVPAPTDDETGQARPPEGAQP